MGSLCRPSRDHAARAQMLIIFFHSQLTARLHTTNMFASLLLIILAVAPIPSGAFSLQKAIFSSRIPSTSMTLFPASTTTRYVTNFGMAVQLDGSSVVGGEISVEKIRKRRHLDEHEVDGASFDKWLMKLNDDSVNTRSYVCRCLVQIAKLSEEDSYHKTIQAHLHGEAIIGEYCQEHAEYYKEALTNSGLTIEIFPVDE